MGSRYFLQWQISSIPVSFSKLEGYASTHYYKHIATYYRSQHKDDFKLIFLDWSLEFLASLLIQISCKACFLLSRFTVCQLQVWTYE